MQYIVDDEVVVDTSISTDSPKVDVDVITGEHVTCDTELVVAGTSLSTDLIIEETKVDDIAVTTPYGIISNEETPVVTPLQVLDYGSSSIEVSFEATTEKAEEVVKGVLCGLENPPTFENADYRLLHGQGSMDLAFAGLHNNTEYYLRPYALSNLGYKYGDVVAQRTKASPIPEEYQLVEYLENNGVQFIDLPYYPHTNTEVTTIFYPFRAQGNDGVFGSSGWYEDPINSFSIGIGNERYLVDMANQRFKTNVFVLINFWSKISLKPEGFYLNDSLVQPLEGGAFNSRNTLRIFSRTAEHAPGVMRIQYFKVSDLSVDIELYSVYRKSDSKPGLYDIINHQFYTNAGTGEFTVGPDKEFEEE